MRKEELRNDPIRENIVKGVEYIKNHQNTIIKIFMGLIILVAIFSYYNHKGSIIIDNASSISGLAQNIFINGNTDEAIVKFERVLDDYPGTLGATQSLIYLLNSALTNEDYEALTNLMSQIKEDINDIEDPVVRAALYKLQGDNAMIKENADEAITFYRMAKNCSSGSALEIKYKFDIISVLLKQEDYSYARSMVENILNIENLGFNEKNNAEELLAFIKHKLGT